MFSSLSILFLYVSQKLSVDAIQLTEAEDEDLKWDLRGALVLDDTDRVKLPRSPNSGQLVRPLQYAHIVTYIYIIPTVPTGYTCKFL